jgi:hypothetical protein
MYCVIVVGSEGDASVLDAGRELVGGALGEVDMLTAAVLVVVVELPLKFLGPGLDSIALGPFGGDLWTGLGATQFGLRLNNGSVDGPVARFIDRGAVGGLSRTWRRRSKSLVRKEQLAMHFLPCPGGVPRPLNGGGDCRTRRQPRHCVCEGGWDEEVTQPGLEVRCRV